MSGAGAADVVDPGAADEIVAMTDPSVGDNEHSSTGELRPPAEIDVIAPAGNPRVDNPHLIYPGDTLSLVWESGQPRLMRVEQGEVKLYPSMRASPLDLAIPAISRQHIEPFLRQHRVVEVATLDHSPYVV